MIRMSLAPRLIMPILLSGLVLSGSLATRVADAAEFTSSQRAEIVAIVRDALKQDPSILRDAVVALQADEGERTQAAARAAIAHHQAQLITPADPVAGDPHGDVTIVEFFDTRCPYCRRLEPVMDSFLAKDRKVRLVYKDLPILGPASVLGTKALFAAQKQDAYGKMREAVMKLPPDTTLPQIEFSGTCPRAGLAADVAGYAGSGGAGADRCERQTGARFGHPGNPGTHYRERSCAGGGRVTGSAKSRGGGQAGLKGANESSLIGTLRGYLRSDHRGYLSNMPRQRGAAFMSVQAK